VSTLTRPEIEDRLMAEGSSRLFVTPLLSRDQIGDISIDLRLGNQFIVFRIHTAESCDAVNMSEEQVRQIQERQVVRFGERFVLHPQTLVLGSTFEYVKMPSDIEGQVEGRSSWARLGLQVATASPVQPGYCGVVTLELSNVGSGPLVLYPGIRVAQLVLRETSRRVEEPYGGQRKYQCAVGPEFSRLHEDRDAEVFCRQVT
jgi:dCTP deaminase